MLLNDVLMQGKLYTTYNKFNWITYKETMSRQNSNSFSEKLNLNISNKILLGEKTHAVLYAPLTHKPENADLQNTCTHLYITHAKQKAESDKLIAIVSSSLCICNIPLNE